MKAAERKTLHDKSAVSSDLEMGRRVLLRNRVKGRNKIQDIWNPTPYIVVGRIAENNTAYIVEKSTDGKVKVVNRVDMLAFAISSEEDTGKADSHSDSISEDELVQLEVHPTRQFSRHRSEPQEPTRKSARQNAGKHSNPHNLPKSALQENASVQPHYTDYSDAIIQLGKLLQEGYNKS